MSNDGTKFKAASHVYAREFDGDLVLLDLARGNYYGLDPIGARLWQGVLAGQSIPALARELAKDYDADTARIEADLMDLHRELVERGLLEPFGSE